MASAAEILARLKGGGSSGQVASSVPSVPAKSAVLSNGSVPRLGNDSPSTPVSSSVLSGSLSEMSAVSVQEEKAPASQASASVPVPLSNSEQILGRISELRTALQNNAPSYEGLLHQIHVALHKDEDVVHLLTEEDIGTICAGLSKKRGIVIATQEMKKRTTASGKALKNIDLGDL